MIVWDESERGIAYHELLMLLELVAITQCPEHHVYR